MIYNYNEIQLYTSIRKEKFKITSWQLRLNTKAKTKRKLKICKDNKTLIVVHPGSSNKINLLKCCFVGRCFENSFECINILTFSGSLSDSRTPK